MSELPLPDGYTFVRRLGESPLSEVFLVVDDDGQRYAWKVLRQSASRDPRIRERWRREAQLLGDLHHPNLVHCFGAWEIGGRPGLLLEYVDGPTLRQRVKDAPMSWEQTARIGIQVARALQCLHRHGAVHRDVKPHNILLDPRRGAVLADLGLVRRREDPTLTRQGAALGSPAYMSPEQARDPSEIGPEADVYSLAASLHHALSGKPPFLGSGVGEVIHRVLHLPPEPLPENVPDALRAVLEVAMAKPPEERYARARDLANDLGRVLVGAAPRLVTRHRLRRRGLQLGAAAGVAAALAAAALWWPSGGDPAIGGDSLVTAEGEGAPEAAQPATRPGDLAAPPSGEAPPRRSDEEFRSWVRPYEQAYRRYLASGQLRRALDEVETLRNVPLPDAADRRFRHLHSTLVEKAQEGILARGEAVSVEAEEILNRRLREATASLEEKQDLDVEAWESAVEEEWQLASLPVTELPLRPGGAEPRRLLRNAAARLQDRRHQLLSQRAAEAIPYKRAQVHAALRDRQPAAAFEAWDSVDPALLPWSLSGRREAERIETLRNFAAASIYEDAPARLRPRIAPTRSEQDWVLAQMYWCRADLTMALDLMRPLTAERWPPERDPGFWVEEWEREMALASLAPPTGEGARREEVLPVAPPAEPEPAEELAEEWRAALPDATVRTRNGGVEISWEEPIWSGEWSRSLRWDRRRFELDGWRVEWQLASDATVPRYVGWLASVEMLRPAPRARPVLRIGRRERVGFGIQPGPSQVLEARDGELFFDGLRVGEWAPPSAGRLELEAAAEPAFTPSRVWVRVSPR